MSRNHTPEWENFIKTAHVMYTEISTLRREVEEKNEKLREIAFIQSHVVRAPLARLIGILHVIQDMDISNEEKESYFVFLLESAKELDIVIKNIVKKTE